MYFDLKDEYVINLIKYYVNMPLISIVSPVYRGEKMVHELVRRITDNVSKISDDFEIVLVNDSSPDMSWNEILKECENDNRVKGINLSRNYGQPGAIAAGMQYAKGQWVVVMDCDLQDRPEEIIQLYNKAKEGYDIVLGLRVERHDSFLKKLSSTVFNKVFSYLCDLDSDKRSSNFGIYKKAVVDQYNKMNERGETFSILIKELGFKTASLPIQHDERLEGKSSYSLNKLLKLAFNLILINTNKPLRLMIYWGFTMAFLSVLFAGYNILAYLFGYINMPGFTTTVFSIWFVGGMLMMQIGIIGIYIGKIFDKVKGRPIYVVMDEVNV